jgi:hypothetical protein
VFSSMLLSPSLPQPVLPNFSGWGPVGRATPVAGLDCCLPPGLEQMQMLQRMQQMLQLFSQILGEGGLMNQSMGMPMVGSNSIGGGMPNLAESFGNLNNAPPASPAARPAGATGQGGQAAVDLGRRFVGRDSWTLRGQLPHFTAAGGRTNNCADFVSSLLESSGSLRGHHVGVRGLERALQQQGWRRVPASRARPGDVWINHSRRHTELVTGAGGTRTIGSNNIRQGHQRISERPKNPNSGVYYTRG